MFKSPKKGFEFIEYYGSKKNYTANFRKPIQIEGATHKRIKNTYNDLSNISNIFLSILVAYSLSRCKLPHPQFEE